MAFDFFASAPLSLGMQAFIRAAYGVLLLLTLLMTLPQSGCFFVSERSGGYAKSGPFADRIQNPAMLPWMLGLWFLSALMILLGSHTVLFSLVNLIFCRYFFIQMRWKGILRGMGAPGFMTYWLAGCVFCLEYALHMDASGRLRSLALTVFRTDFAAIILSAGLYKLLCGYPKNEGMEYGMVNPWWGYWWRFYKKLPPGHLLFRSLNHLAYGTEILAAVLLFIPSTQVLGALLIIGSFLFIATHIRLGFLCEMVMVAALVYMSSGSIGDRTLGSWVLEPGLPREPGLGDLSYVNLVFALFLWGYLIMIPLAHAGLWYNFLLRRSLPNPLQKSLERYANLFGVIIWRVFTIDVINFFANIYILNRGTGRKKLYSRFGALDWSSHFRYLHVGEFVCLASIFTTRKYYPSNWALFEERLMRYAKTVPCPEDSVVVFEQVNITKSKKQFEFVPVREYLVDVFKETIRETQLDEGGGALERDQISLVHEGAYPGTYVPLETAGR